MGLFSIYLRDNGLLNNGEDIEIVNTDGYESGFETAWKRSLYDKKIYSQEQLDRLMPDIEKYIEEACIKLLLKFQDGENTRILDREFNTILHNAIVYALKKENSDLAALNDKIRDILKQLSDNKKVFKVNNNNNNNNNKRNYIRRSENLRFALKPDYKELLEFSYKDKDERQEIIDYSHQINLDKKYDLIINDPEKSISTKNNYCRNQIDEIDKEIRKRNFNCKKGIRDLIEDFFTNLTPPRPTEKYIWKSFQASLIMADLYNENYNIRLNNAKKVLDEAELEFKNAIDQKEELGTPDSLKTFNYFKNKFETTKKKYDTIKNEYRAKFDNKTTGLFIKNEDGKETEKSINNNSSEKTQEKIIDSVFNAELCFAWVRDSMRIITGLKKFRIKITFYLLKKMLEEPEFGEILQINQTLKQNFYERYNISHREEKNTPTIFISKFLNISTGTTSNYKDEMEKVIKRRFMKYQEMTGNIVYSQEDSDYLEVISIPIIHPRAQLEFWNELANICERELEVRL